MAVATPAAPPATTRRKSVPDVPQLDSQLAWNLRDLRRVALPDQPARKRKPRLRHVIDEMYESSIDDQHIDRALGVLRRSGALETLELATRQRTGRRRHLTVQAFCVAALIVGGRADHRQLLVRIGGVLNRMKPHQRRLLGVDEKWNEKYAHDRVGDMLAHLARLLDRGLLVPKEVAQGFGVAIDPEAITHTDGPLVIIPTQYTSRDDEPGPDLHFVDFDWFLNVVLRAGIDPALSTSKAWALDGTAWETPARLHGDPEAVAVDADLPADLTEKERAAAQSKGSARVLGVGADGRKVYTLDADARAGYRTATSGQRGRTYVGYEVHLGVQVRDRRWNGSPEHVSLGPEVPGVITVASMSPAGSHRADAMTPLIIRAKRAGVEVDELIADPGYSLMGAGRYHGPLREADIRVLHEPKAHQRGDATAISSRFLQVDDTFLHPDTPKHLLTRKDGQGKSVPLPYAPIGTSGQERKKYQAPFNARANWRMRLHKVQNGKAWFICPFCNGTLKAPGVKRRVSRNGQPGSKGNQPNKNALPVTLPKGREYCCDGLVPVPLGDLGRWQDIPVGTTAHDIAYHGRRNQVENCNSAVKSTHTVLSKNHTLVFGRVKRSLLLAFTLAGVNQRVCQSFARKIAAEVPPPSQRKPKADTRSASPQQRDTASNRRRSHPPGRTAASET